jgi:phosphotransferase system enzyme I (PtsI)
MRILTGTSTSERIVSGTLRRYRRVIPAFPHEARGGWQAERARYLKARKQAVRELALLQEQMRHQAGEENALIFNIHALLLEDPDFDEQVLQLLQGQDATAEFAVWQASRSIAAGFSAMADPYMRARSADFRDIGLRVIRLLQGQDLTIHLSESTILFCDELLPSEAVSLDRQHLAGVVSHRGSVYSHSALLLTALHIPVLVGADVPEDAIGCHAVLDGQAGQLCVEPEEDFLLPDLEQLLGESSEPVRAQAVAY